MPHTVPACMNLRQDTMETQDDSPPLDPSFAPALLFKPPGHSGAEADQKPPGVKTKTPASGGNDGIMFLYSIPKRQLLTVTGLFDYFDSDATWITPQGWVLVLDGSTRDAFLRDPFTSRTVRLPSDQDSLLPSNQRTRCFLSTPRPTAAADDGDGPGACTVLLVHREDPVLWYCSPGGSQWFRHEYLSGLITRDHDMAMWAMGTLASARGNFYAHVFEHGHHKLLTLEFSPGPIFSTTPVVITPFLSGLFQIRLIESCGDLFFLRISLEPFRGKGVMEIYVYKLVLSNNNAWVKVAALDDNRVFFSARDKDEFGASMAADEVGLKANCIYFTLEDDKGLYVHDLEQGTTILHNPGHEVPDSIEPLLLMHAQGT